MVQSGTHHQSIRKRIHQQGEAYPHPDAFKRFYDSFIYAVAIITPLTNLPQLLRVWSTKDASGVSVLSWSSFAVLSLAWMIYGILHKDKPIVFVNALLIVFQTVIAIGAFLYS